MEYDDAIVPPAAEVEAEQLLLVLLARRPPGRALAVILTRLGPVLVVQVQVGEQGLDRPPSCTSWPRPPSLYRHQWLSLSSHATHSRTRHVRPQPQLADPRILPLLYMLQRPTPSTTCRDAELERQKRIDAAELVQMLERTWMDGCGTSIKQPCMA
ncbi:hypothetical protein D1007_32376 [Hordeum vulgare]|nr:hypothetical protein D1007_32376 [Hordeum vulgare]